MRITVVKLNPLEQLCTQDLPSACPIQHALLIPRCFDLEVFPYVLIQCQIENDQSQNTKDILTFCKVKTQDIDLWKRKSFTFCPDVAPNLRKTVMSVLDTQTVGEKCTITVLVLVHPDLNDPPGSPCQLKVEIIEFEKDLQP